MPITLKLTFTAGRYHATPWGRHVNEGVAEWPPSPWRLLRALVATWKRKCPDLAEETVLRILRAIASPPCFHLPPTREAHLRHVMPMNVLARNYKPSQSEKKKGKFQGDPSLVLDPFVSISRERPIFIHWSDTNLTDEDRAALARLVANLSTLGRAESWVGAELFEADGISWNCTPRADGQDGAPIVRVLCADPATAFAGEFYPTHDPKKIKKGLAASDLLFDCPRWHLCLDTETIHARRWPSVPGARWMTYSLPRDIALDAVENPAAPRHRTTGFTVARFLFDGPVLPLITETLPLAEQARSALMSVYRQTKTDRDPERSEVISGKAADGQPLRDGRGAYYLPADEDGDDRIDHITIYAKNGGLGGSDSPEVRALDALRHLRFGDGELSLRLVGLGQPEDFAGNTPLGASRTWISATPFLVTRHLKRRGRKRDPREWFKQPDGIKLFVRQVLEESLARLDLPDVEIESLDHVGKSRRIPVDFRLSRKKIGDDGGRRRHGFFLIRFPKPIAGPITVGHSCHFGLGLFMPH